MILIFRRYDDQTAVNKYDELRNNLRDFVGITDRGMDAIIKSISVLLILGNSGFQQVQAGIKVTSRKFHTFPDGLEICEDLLDLEPGMWKTLQTVY